MFIKEANTNNLNNSLFCCFGCSVLSLLCDSLTLSSPLSLQSQARENPPLAGEVAQRAGGVEPCRGDANWARSKTWMRAQRADWGVESNAQLFLLFWRQHKQLANSLNNRLLCCFGCHLLFLLFFVKMKIREFSGEPILSINYNLWLIYGNLCFIILLHMLFESARR